MQSLICEYTSSISRDSIGYFERLRLMVAREALRRDQSIKSKRQERRAASKAQIEALARKFAK